MGQLSSRRILTTQRITDLRSNLKSAEKLVRGNACVYMTGSFGRGEASAHSDLDLFILGKGYGRDGPDGKRKSKLSRLDGICLMAELIDTTRKLNFPEFSGDGRWLVNYSEDELIKTLGTQNDGNCSPGQAGAGAGLRARRRAWRAELPASLPVAMTEMAAA